MAVEILLGLFSLALLGTLASGVFYAVWAPWERNAE